MDYQQLLYILMNVSFFSYIIYIAKNYGILSSISISYYSLPEKRRFLFLLALWGFAFPAIILGGNFLTLIAGTGICIVPVAAQIRNKFISQVHEVGAIGGILAAVAALIFYYNLWWLAAAFALFAILMFVFKVDNKIYWVEIGAFASIDIALFIEVFLK